MLEDLELMVERGTEGSVKLRTMNDIDHGI